MSVAQDRCPGILRLHQAADGLLARVRLPGGRLPADAIDAIAAAAVHGNGIVELTARAAIQIRGLTGGAEAAVHLAAAGLLPAAGHERVRNILASPVAGRHANSLAETDALVAELDRALCDDPELANLSGRFLFAVDDGAGLIGHDADVTILATGPDHFCIGGRDLTRAQAVAAALDAARRLLNGEPGLAGLGHGEPAAALPLGAFTQHDGRTAVTAMPPLARVDPDQLAGLASLVRAHATELRLSTRRTLTVIDLEPTADDAVQSELERLGLIVDPDAGWVGLTACAGIGACAKATFDVRAAAARRAAQRDGHGRDLPAEHWAACERNCGLPTDAIRMEAA